MTTHGFHNQRVWPWRGDGGDGRMIATFLTTSAWPLMMKMRREPGATPEIHRRWSGSSAPTAGAGPRGPAGTHSAPSQTLSNKLNTKIKTKNPH
jgi:hypothetical protein